LATKVQQSFKVKADVSRWESGTGEETEQQKTGPARPRFVWPVAVLHQLNGHGGGFTATDAQAGHTAFAASAFQRVNQGKDNA